MPMWEVVRSYLSRNAFASHSNRTYHLPLEHFGVQWQLNQTLNGMHVCYYGGMVPQVCQTSHAFSVQSKAFR